MTYENDIFNGTNSQNTIKLRAARNVTVAPIEKEKQCSVRFKISITYFICVWEICKMKGFPFSWDNNLTSCDHLNSCSVLQYFTSEEALKPFCSLRQIKTPVLYSGLLFLRLSCLIPMLQLQKKVSSKLKMRIDINRKNTLLWKWIFWISWHFLSALRCSNESCQC